MLKVGLDIQSLLGFKTGIGYYTDNLLKYLNDYKDFRFFLYKDDKKEDLNTLERMKWENFTLPHLACNDNVDILHIPGFAGPLFRNKYKKVTTVHDLIGMVYPKNLGPISRFYWQRWLPVCIRSSDFIIADSESTKKDIVRFLKFPTEKISVIYLAADLNFKPQKNNRLLQDTLKKFGIYSNYILNVGTVEPRKNIVTLITAFAKYIKTTKSEVLLVIAGRKGWDYNRCLNKIFELRISDRVIFCDYITEEDLVSLYNLADLFVYPSFYEGFGLPVLEAMCCGAPVVCSDTSSLPEIAGDAAIFVKPNDVDGLCNAIGKVLSTPGLSISMREKSLKQAAKFSWENTAKQTIEVYKSIIN
jgi:glycosyltransferase involved in cell wall biosynthesis